MDQKLFGIFSGRQLTAIAIAAILAPSALFAAVTYTAVGIIDPNSGSKSYVDPSRKLWVYDPVAGYRNSPAGFVNILVSNSGSQCENSYAYTVPAGKAFVLTAISGFETSAGDHPYAGFEVFAGGGCSGSLLTSHFSSVSDSVPEAPVTIDLGSGIPVKAGSVISVASYSNNGYTHLHGYLIPAGTLPSAGSAEAAYQRANTVTAAETIAKLSKRRH